MKYVRRFAGCGLVLAGLSLSGAAHAWEMKQAPLMTDWAQLVDTANPLPEYPRPQMVRADWLNLNGIWEFQPGAPGDSLPTNQTLAGEILVPFPMESALSGVMQHHAHSWYRRTFVVPPEWNGRILLHFGAVDWESEVFINGQSVGVHKGGYDPFSYDITPYLSGTGPQELIVRVYDPTDALGVPRGKQTLSPGGIMYTACSGIWQTVWLEPVSSRSISSFKLVPDVDNENAKLTVQVSGPTNDLSVHATARIGANLVGEVSGLPGATLSLPVPNPNLWSPTNPFLYDLDIVLSNGNSRVDQISSYFGMRKISLGTNNGFVKMLLNDEFVFQFGPLDQGFWPDGIYTAPTDDALKSDIEQTKAFGWNLIRKHIKVEPARWYYWADKLGVLVWQDMPSANSYTGNPQPLDKPQFKTELTRMIQNLGNHPSIISWVVFNESQGQHDTPELVQWVREFDASRLINQASGGSFFGVGDILDWHSYPDPSCPASATQAVVCGEFGGVGLPVTNHTWAPGWGYVAATNADDLAAKFEDFCFQLSGFVHERGLSAAVYTEITDVEIELNGFLTYDRKVRKPDVERIRAAIASIGTPSILTTVQPTSETNVQSWRYTTTTPAANWFTREFDDASWNIGPAGFGAGDPPNTDGLRRTTWNTPDIWLRRTFNPGPLSAQQISNLHLRIYHDENVEIYINGVLAGSASGYRTAYGLMAMTEAGRAAIIPNAQNVIAVHCHQTGGGQYIDVGLVVRETTTVESPAPDVPPVPTNLRAAAGTLGISLGWSSSAEATGYRVKRAIASGGPYTNLVVETAVNAFTDTTATPGNTFYYVVSALNVSGESADSIEISATAVIPPPPELRAWFKADGISGVAHNAALHTWPDASGNGFDATQSVAGHRPRFLSAAMNGLPAVRFDAAQGSFMEFARPVEDDFTILCVYRSSQGVGSGTHFYEGAGLVNGEVALVVNDFGLSLNANGRLLAGTGNPDVTIASSDSNFNDGEPHVVTFRRKRSTGEIDLHVDGVFQGRAVGGKHSLTAPVRLVLGAQQTLIHHLTGEIAEVKIFGAALNDAERVGEEHALMCKYGLGSGAAPSAPVNFSAVAGNRTITLGWQPASGATSYTLRWSTNAASEFTVVSDTITGTEFTHTNAANGLTNYYEISANGPCGESEPAKAAVLLPLPKMAVNVNNSVLTVSWPGWASDWLLYSATNLTPPIVWLQVTNFFLAEDGFFKVNLPMTQSACFLRLAGP